MNKTITIVDENNKLIDHEIIEDSLESSLSKLTELLFYVPYSKGLDLNSYNFILRTRGVRYKVLVIPSEVRLQSLDEGTLVLLNDKSEYVLVDPNDVNINKISQLVPELSESILLGMSKDEHIVNICKSLCEVYKLKLIIV